MFSYYYNYYRLHIIEELCCSLLCYAYKRNQMASKQSQIILAISDVFSSYGDGHIYRQIFIVDRKQNILVQFGLFANIQHLHTRGLTSLTTFLLIPSIKQNLSIGLNTKTVHFQHHSLVERSRALLQENVNIP